MVEPEVTPSMADEPLAALFSSPDPEPAAAEEASVSSDTVAVPAVVTAAVAAPVIAPAPAPKLTRAEVIATLRAGIVAQLHVARHTARRSVGGVVGAGLGAALGAMLWGSPPAALVASPEPAPAPSAARACPAEAESQRSSAARRGRVARVAGRVGGRGRGLVVPAERGRRAQFAREHRGRREVRSAPAAR
jgi:hypothetical protein